jgi:RNA polymerase-binding transcription factor DksA
MPTPTISPSALADLAERLERRRLEATHRDTCLFDEALKAIEPCPQDPAAVDRPPQPPKVQELAALAHLAALDVRAADEALIRLSEGTYGTCAQCGGSIPLARLVEWPEVSSCAPCEPVRHQPSS